MTTTFYSPSLHRTCFLVLGCLFVLNCLVIFVIWEETLKRGSSSIKVPVDFGLCYKGLWPVEKAFALCALFQCGDDFHIQHKAKSFDCWCGWLLLSDFRSLPTESWIIVCFPWTTCLPMLFELCSSTAHVVLAGPLPESGWCSVSIR